MRLPGNMHRYILQYILVKYMYVMSLVYAKGLKLYTVLFRKESNRD
jgi:hypothetical protein